MLNFIEWCVLKEFSLPGQNTGVDKQALNSGMQKIMQFCRQKFNNTPISGTLNSHVHELGLETPEIKACNALGALTNFNRNGSVSIETNVVQSYFNPSSRSTFRANGYGG